MSVEWIHGKVPTAVFLDDRNQVIKNDQLEDMDAEALAGWLSERGFQMVEKKHPYPDKPTGVGEFEESKYEYFKVANSKATSQEFAESRGGHLLAIDSEEEALYIALEMWVGTWRTSGLRRLMRPKRGSGTGRRASPRGSNSGRGRATEWLLLDCMRGGEMVSPTILQTLNTVP